MKRTATKGEEPLSTFALIVIGLEMLTVAGVIWYACTEAGNVGHAPTWFGECSGSFFARHRAGPRAAEGDVMGEGIGLDAWWNEPDYKQARTTLVMRGAFILRKLRDHDEARLRTVMNDLYRESDWPDPQDIGRFEWQIILAYMGASDVEIADVQKRMRRVWR